MGGDEGRGCEAAAESRLSSPNLIFDVETPATTAGLESPFGTDNGG
jgi:hypothetical protein